MANSLNVALVESIRSLFAQGWSRRRIARELGVDRETVGKYVSQELDGQNPPNLPTGSRTSKPATFPGLPGRSFSVWAAGEEAQVDFGTGAPVIQPDGKRRKTHVFRIVLSHSRKATASDVYARRPTTSSAPWRTPSALRRRAEDAGHRQPQGGRRCIPTGSIPN
jgi:hypothetical protein